jgi:hypothetical protein
MVRRDTLRPMPDPIVQVFGTRVWPLADVPSHVAYRQVLLGSADGRLSCLGA